jgi:hypothetical protein
MRVGMKEFILRAQGNITKPVLDVVCNASDVDQARTKALEIVRALFGTYSYFTLFENVDEDDWRLVARFNAHQPAIEIEVEEY